jgi:hypothetical protein
MSMSRPAAEFEVAARQIPLSERGCPVDRLPTIRRNRICLRIIIIGLLNFLLYTICYAALGGDAHNGGIHPVVGHDGVERDAYFVRGHFIRDPAGKEREVHGWLWIYSYLHSISVFATSGAMLISMLVLARPHIIATMRGGWISGQVFIVSFGTIVVLVSSAAMFIFAWDFVAQLNS